MTKDSCIKKLRQLANYLETAAEALETLDVETTRDLDSIFLFIIRKGLIDVFAKTIKSKKREERIRIINTIQ